MQHVRCGVEKAAAPIVDHSGMGFCWRGRLFFFFSFEESGGVTGWRPALRDKPSPLGGSTRSSLLSHSLSLYLSPWSRPRGGRVRGLCVCAAVLCVRELFHNRVGGRRTEGGGPCPCLSRRASSQWNEWRVVSGQFARLQQRPPGPRSNLAQERHGGRAFPGRLPNTSPPRKPCGVFVAPKLRRATYPGHG